MLIINHVYKSYKQSSKWFSKQNRIQVLKDISFSIPEGTCVGLIGESGSGKSTLSRLILGLEKPDKGNIEIEGKPVTVWIKENRGQMSVVFQDYTSSANPNFTVYDVICEPLKLLGQTHNLEQTVRQLLEKVGLSDTLINRYPHELSGGQLQRVCIARAISSHPKILVLDEAISSLDVSVQAQVLDLLKQLKKEMQMTYLFIAHDLQAVTYLCDRLLFLYKGQIVEQVACKDLAHVQNNYAQKLLQSVIPFSV